MNVRNKNIDYPKSTKLNVKMRLLEDKAKAETRLSRITRKQESV